MQLGGGTVRNFGNAERWTLADAELGFDAGHAIVQFNDFADKRVKPNVQPIESVVDAVESRVESIIKDGIHQDTYQYRESRYADRQI
jgi:hypothetical protein